MPLTADPTHAPSTPEERRQIAAEAQASLLEEWLDALLATSPAAIGIISAMENRYVRANPALIELYGIPLEELLNIDPFTLAFQFTHPEDMVREQVLFAELAIGARRSYRIEKRFVRRDGSIRWGILDFSAGFAPAADPGAVVGPLSFAVVQIIDITEQKALTESLQRREAELLHTQKIDGIGRLAAGIAHDFNNLLTVITGHGEVLKTLITRTGGALERELQEDLTAILTASERAAGLTAQLLAHGRRETAVPRTHLLSDLVSGVHRLLWRTLGSHIEVEQSLTAAGAIFADRGQVGQVVMNLMLNARDALNEGGSIRLETADVAIADGATGVPGPGQWVALVVADTGHGMDVEVQARIFEPFFTTRADRPGMQGNGLGLSTVQRIVADLGAQLQVESAPGAGTRVSIFFPRVASTAPIVELPPRQPPVPAPNSRRVLVIEDEPSVRSLVATVLTGAHYWVMVARNGEEGLRVLEAEQQPFHLIVTDLVMPRVGGIMLAQRLLERGDPARVLFVSGYSNHTTEELARYGELLPKPFSPTQLLAAVAQALGDPV